MNAKAIFRSLRSLRALVPTLLLSCLFALLLTAQQGFQSEAFQGEELERFLKEAKVTDIEDVGKGVTLPMKATLQLNGTTHQAVFKTIDVRKPMEKFADGTVEFDFQDTWKTEVAAYELDRLLGLGMIPVTIERVHEGRHGSLQFWMTVKMAEADRVKKKLNAPNTNRWNEQMHKMRVFDNLIYNTDRHLNNILITEDFQIRLIDHSRSFRVFDRLQTPKTLTRFSKMLLEKMEQLTEPQLQQRMGDYLSPGQIRALLKRRDLILTLSRDLVKQKGEAAVLYP